jgi:hypothetical protein
MPDRRVCTQKCTLYLNSVPHTVNGLDYGVSARSKWNFEKLRLEESRLHCTINSNLIIPTLSHNIALNLYFI